MSEEHNNRESLFRLDTLHVSAREFYSVDYIKAAARFARLSADAEKRGEGDHLYLHELKEENNSYVIASILAAVSFLESTINELFADAADDYEPRTEQLNPDVVKSMANMWQLGVPRTASFSIPKKYQIALVLSQKPMFDAGTAIYQNVDLLISLRNSLVHYEPEFITWFAIGEVAPYLPTRRKLTEGLKGKFPVNRLTANSASPFFPDKCLGHGCAQWAVESSIKFADEFFSRMELIAIHDKYRDALNTK